MKIDARLSYSKIRFDAEADAHLVVSLTAPPLDADVVRPSLAMVVCVDTSGSMAGRKLDYAKLSILKLIEHMKPDDYLGIVAFESNVHVISPPVKLANKDAMRKLVNGLHVQGGTNFAGGMLKAIDLLKAMDLGVNYIHRIVMFTDGQANEGPATKPAEIIKFFKANAPAMISASAFGYGQGVGDFDAQFLTDFAREGRGNYAHVEDPDKALQAFGTELGGLISTYATNIRVEIATLAGHTIEKVVSDVTAEEEVTGEIGIKVPDLLAEETRHLVLAVKFAKQKSAGPRQVNVASAKIVYEVFDVTGKKIDKTGEAKAKIQFVKDGDEQKVAELDDIIGLAQLVRTQLDAEEQAKKGNFAVASNMLQAQADVFRIGGNDRLAAAAAGMSGRLGSAQLYALNQGYLRSFERGASRGMGGTYSAEVADDLLGLGVVTSNSVQSSTSASFAQPVAVPAIVPAAGGVHVFPAGQLAQPGNYHVSPVADAQLVANLLGNLHVPTPVPVPNETDNAKSPDKASARKPVKQSRSNKNW
jgi:hypothetical protein